MAELCSPFVFEKRSAATSLTAPCADLIRFAVLRCPRSSWWSHWDFLAGSSVDPIQICIRVQHTGPGFYELRLYFADASLESNAKGREDSAKKCAISTVKGCSRILTQWPMEENGLWTSVPQRLEVWYDGIVHYWIFTTNVTVPVWLGESVPVNVH